MSDRLFKDCCYGTEWQHGESEPCPQRFAEATDNLRAPLYRLLLSATSVDQELRNEVDDAFKALDALTGRQGDGE